MKKLIYLLTTIILFLSCQKDLTFEDTRQNYTGTWSVSESNKSSQITKYEVSISPSSKDDDIIIVKNFANLGKNTQAKLRVFEYIIILNTQDIDGFKVEKIENGKARSDYSQFNIKYKLDGDIFEAKFTKK